MSGPVRPDESHGPDRFLLVRHGDEPEDDRVTAFFRAAGARAETVRPFRGEALDLGGLAGAVVFGGPFSVFEEARHPFLRDEARLIETCLARGLPILGICQGAQQIARVLDAEVAPHAQGLHEFGYYEVTPTEAGRSLFPGPLVVAQSHWHGFGLPPGAELLASSAAFRHQAMRHGPALAFQFHAEVTPAGFRRWQAAPWAPWDRPGAQDRATQDRLMAAHDTRQAAWFEGVLAAHFGPALAAARAALPGAAAP